MVHETVFIFAISRQMVIGQVVHSFAFFTTLSLYSNLPGLPPRVTLPEKSVHYKEQQGRNFSDYIIF